MPVADIVKHEIEVPEGVDVRLEGFNLHVKGPLGEMTREFKHTRVKMSIQDGKVVVYCPLPKKKEYAMAGTWKAHVQNMIKGVTEGFEYHLKILYAHFPMKVTVKGDKVVIENFLGERAPRYADIFGDSKVEVKGDTIIVKSINKEHAGQTAANIERATRVKNRDPRVFQDGIYIVKKG
ncbi:archaeal ribosomal protein L6P [Aciduliprofundum sp. MAR08-339]|uniref:50S ribosomal protein L6 n=1 Tax=Aciduliprofundum sp. (strain MAR08-339) TaxID=673860 RepID=UPI0002A4A4D7|nr:archaeal ribosomal protein L6P [Aciduliprofundum sp. MAR08-339]